jgi:hypothetical protein
VPAPAPSRVMVAAAKPFIPNADDGKHPPSDGKFMLSSASSRRVTPTPSGQAATTASRPQANAGVRSASAVDGRSAAAAEVQTASPTPTSAPAAPALGFFPLRNENGGALGLMSRRGLY